MMQVAINRIGAIARKIWLSLLIYLTVIFLSLSKARSSEVEAVSAEKNQNQFSPILTIDELKKMLLPIIKWLKSHLYLSFQTCNQQIGLLEHYNLW